MSGPATVAPLTLTWVEGFDALSAYFDLWTDLVQRTKAEIFLSPLWLKAWWPELGTGRPLKALLAHSDGRLVGLLPFMIDRIWVGPLPVTIARFAATDPNCMILTLPVEPGFVAAMVDAACTALLTDHGCTMVSLTPVSDRASFLHDICDLGKTRTDLVLTHLPQGTHCLFTLPATFQDYLATQVSGKRRGQFRRETVGLQETFDLQTRNFTPSSAEFDDFVAFHNVQWHAVGKGGHFSDWPRSHESYRALGPLTEGRRGLRFFGQTGNTGPLATQLCFMSDERCHWRLPARTLDPRADKLGIGKFSLMQMIDDLIAAGVTQIEAGRGDYEYKTAHGGQNIPVHRMILSRNTLPSRLCLNLLLAWSDAVDFLYYRVWFKKISPELRKRIGLPAPPLWRLWIGSRV
jgi:CelD/BcsL family acetyltransferase involved in cellulose biosynthesis